MAPMVAAAVRRASPHQVDNVARTGLEREAAGSVDGARPRIPSHGLAPTNRKCGRTTWAALRNPLELAVLAVVILGAGWSGPAAQHSVADSVASVPEAGPPPSTAPVPNGN